MEEIDVRIAAQRTAVIGANGSGKSSFVRMLNGLAVPSTGTVQVLGMDPAREAKALRSRVGFIFANADAQILMPTPVEDVALSLRGLPRAEARGRALEVLDRFGLGAFAEAPAAELSGGQKQLLAIASILATEPELVVADEPTTMLDRRNARMIGDLLLEGIETPVVFVTHDLELAARCDEAVLFDEGRVVSRGRPDAVIAAYCGAVG
nr:ABC transporter ATP-binding protein [Microbacterium pseudoresistens]